MLLQRDVGEKMVVILVSEYVYKGVVECSPKWRQHSWKASSVGVRHRDLWEHSLEL